MEKVFGIDLGTTYSCISYIDDSGEPVVLKNAEDGLTTPSVVYFEDENTVIVGETAKEYAVMHPLQSVSLIKRDMGQEGKYREINGIRMRPEEISARILSKLVRDATDSLKQKKKLGENEEIKDVVITCPAYFGTAERDATENAGKIAGLNVLAIINEPTAAAINYGVITNESDKNVLVYDLGGGTFDVTIINITKEQIKVVVTGGNHVLGGADWDKDVIDYVAMCFENETGISGEDLKSNPESLQELTISVEKAKKMLTAKPKAPINVNFDGEHMRMELTREKFDELTSDHLQQTIVLTKDAISEYEKKGYKKSDISEILLVGGSSKMPQVKRIVDETFGIPSKLYDPDEAVSKGASRYAANIKYYAKLMEEQKEDEILINPPETNGWGLPGITSIIDVTSRTYGLEVIGDKIVNFIFKNTELPADLVTKEFGPATDYQSKLRIAIYESLTGEKEIPLSMGTYVGEATIELPPNTLTSDKLEIKFHLNNKGLLEMYARELKTGNEVNASFDVSGGMSEEELQQAINRSTGISVS